MIKYNNNHIVNTVFCGKHRSPVDHACKFDHRATHRSTIATANPVIQAAKFNKI
jgi:hypothetical protein